MIEIFYAVSVAIAIAFMFLIRKLIKVLEKDFEYKKQYACETRQRQRGENILCMKLMCGGECDESAGKDKKLV